MKKTVLAMGCLAILGSLLLFGMPVATLQAGDGKVIAETRCTVCHGIGRVEKAGYKRDGWVNTVNRMMSKDNFGAKLNDAEYEALLDYLVSLSS